MNEYEKACKEWLKGCSCADDGNPEECEECTKAFFKHIKTLSKSDHEIYLCGDRGDGTIEILASIGIIPKIKTLPKKDYSVGVYGESSFVSGIFPKGNAGIIIKG